MVRCARYYKYQGLFKTIGGEEAGNSLKVLTDQAGNGELQKLVATLEQADGEAANLAKTMSDNALGDFTTMPSVATSSGFSFAHAVVFCTILVTLLMKLRIAPELVS